MKYYTPALVALFLAGGMPAGAQTPGAEHMTISEGATRAAIAPPDTLFTGKVFVDPLFLKPQAPSRATGSYVTFEPGARTAWHTHPLGQTLVVTSGTGWIQEWGGQRKTIHAGDVIYTPPGVKHWHGATDKTLMVHLAIQELDQHDSNVEWMEKVTDEQYARQTNGR